MPMTIRNIVLLICAALFSVSMAVQASSHEGEMKDQATEANKEMMQDDAKAGMKEGEMKGEEMKDGMKEEMKEGMKDGMKSEEKMK